MGIPYRKCINSCQRLGQPFATNLLGGVQPAWRLRLALRRGSRSAYARLAAAAQALIVRS